jgi:hypothetical protein
MTMRQLRVGSLLLSCSLSLTDHTRYELASSNGCLRAVNILGMMYYEGLGVPKLREKAFALFEEASLVVPLSPSLVTSLL